MGNYFSSQRNLEEKLCQSCLLSYHKSLLRKVGSFHGSECLPSVAEQGHPICLDALIKAGAVRDKHHHESVYQDVLHMALRSGNIACVKILVEEGAYMNHLGQLFRPLSMAADSGNEECVEYLLEKGADVNGVDRIGRTALHCAAEFGYDDILNLLLKAGADVSIVYRSGRTPLHSACEDGHRMCVDLLIQGGADVNAVDNEGNTALNTASASSEAGRLECVKLLLRSGAKMNLYNNKKYNALCSHIYKSKYLNKPPDRTMVLLLYAAGETLDGIIIDEDDENTSCVLDYLEKQDINLRELCREAVRNHLLQLDLHGCLFNRIPQLGLPKLLTQYLLCNMSLENDCSSE